MMLIQVAETHPPRPGGKVAYLHAADGQKFEIWPEKLDGVQVGRAYEIEIRERAYDGRTIRSITRITPAATPAVAPAPVSSGSPGTRLNASPHPGEAEYVGRVLAGLIAKGECDKAQVATATAFLRKVWRGS
jgi:hypothetical protein